jgi:hypothetical protein
MEAWYIGLIVDCQKFTALHPLPWTRNSNQTTGKLVLLYVTKANHALSEAKQPSFAFAPRNHGKHIFLNQIDGNQSQTVDHDSRRIY